MEWIVMKKIEMKKNWIKYIGKNLLLEKSSINQKIQVYFFFVGPIWRVMCLIYYIFMELCAYIYICRDKAQNYILGLGPWALAENVGWSEDE